MPKIFFAFPSQPNIISENYASAFAEARKIASRNKFKAWTDLRINGQVIWQSIISEIETCDVLAADITALNANVLYEIGYAIALKKPIVLFLDSSLTDQDALRTRLGLFDIIGHERYRNAADLTDKIASIREGRTAFPISLDLDYRAPVFLLDSYQKEGLTSSVYSWVQKLVVHFRSFDPVEKARLPFHLAIREISSSIGIIITFVPNSYAEAEIHNFRASFLSGLSRGLNKETLILQLGDRPTPLDFRDDTVHCNSSAQVKRAVTDFAANLLPLIQEASSSVRVSGHTFLEQLQIGASVAENELQHLHDYFLHTDAYRRVARSEARVVVGRKGSGKTAIFAFLRDEKKRNRADVVVDLKPEGYKLLKFRDDVLALLQPGSLDHVVTALWDYVLLLEIAFKLLEMDRNTHHNNHKINPLYRRLKEIYFQQNYHSEGDFSERLSALLEIVSERWAAFSVHQDNTRLSNPQVAELLYMHPIAELRRCLIEYLKLKEEVWVLIDNVDKGWPSDGLTAGDISLVKCLIEGMEKLRRQLMREGEINCTSVVFLRNDVFEHLIEGSSDRGKISSVSVDWTDRALLKEMLRLRLTHGGVHQDLSFDEAWSRIACANVGEKSSINFLLDRSLMRPRALLDLVMACKGFAVNRRHSIIEPEDFIDGYKNFSLDLLENVSLEIRDVAPEIENALYIFIDKSPSMKLAALKKNMKDAGVPESKRDALISLFLWYGVLGVEVADQEVRYIHDVNYNFRMLKTLSDRQGAGMRFTLNPAFRQALAVSDPSQALQPRLL